MRKFEITSEVIKFWEFQFDRNLVETWKNNADLTEVLEFDYEVDQNKVRGYLVMPKQIVGKVPIILFSRGGYKDFGRVNSFYLFGLLSTLARQGFAVLASQKQGNSFSEGKDTWGGDNHLGDLLKLREVVKDDARIDVDRVGLLGVSRGGIEVYKILKKAPDFVKAAVTIGSTTDLIKMLEARPDLNWVFDEAFGKTRVGMEDRSLAYWHEDVSKQIPLLALQGAQDERTPVSQAEVFKKMGDNVKLKVIEEGNHSLSNWNGLQECLVEFWNSNLRASE